METATESLESIDFAKIAKEAASRAVVGAIVYVTVTELAEFTFKVMKKKLANRKNRETTNPE